VTVDLERISKNRESGEKGGSFLQKSQNVKSRFGREDMNRQILEHEEPLM
jgi:hypothetical protein